MPFLLLWCGVICGWFNWTYLELPGVPLKYLLYLSEFICKVIRVVDDQLGFIYSRVELLVVLKLVT